MVGGGASVALDDPATRRAVEEYRRTAQRTLAVGVVWLVVAVVAAGVGDVEGGSGGVAGAVFGVGLIIGMFGVGVGAWGGRTAATIREVLGRSPWSEVPASRVVAPWGRNGYPVLVLRGDGPDAERLMVPSSLSFWNKRLSIDRSDTVLLAWGGPDWAVAAPPDRSVLVVVKESSGPYPER